MNLVFLIRGVAWSELHFSKIILLGGEAKLRGGGEDEARGGETGLETVAIPYENSDESLS